MAYKSNVAYDFSRFAPVEIPEVPVEEPKKVNTVVKKKKAKKQQVTPLAVIKFVFVSLFVMASLGSIMVGNIKITQLNDETDKMEKLLDTARSEQVSLNSKLENRMSISKVEDYASNNLGLVKTQAYQIQYVQLTNEDKVEILGNSGGIQGFFQNVINSIEEYFA